MDPVLVNSFQKRSLVRIECGTLLYRFVTAAPRENTRSIARAQGAAKS
jgi:hypothetical protein